MKRHHFKLRNNESFKIANKASASFELFRYNFAESRDANPSEAHMYQNTRFKMMRGLTRNVKFIGESVGERGDSSVVNHQKYGLRKVRIDFIGDTIRDVIRDATKTSSKVVFSYLSSASKLT